jgi:uncharacterized protein YjbJ (UPF0337 family)
MRGSRGPDATSSRKEHDMNWTQIEGKWDQLKGDVKSAWAKLTDDDIKRIGGQLDKLVGTIVERYGVEKERAHEQVREWADRIGTRMAAAGRSPESRANEARDDRPRGTQRH